MSFFKKEFRETVRENLEMFMAIIWILPFGWIAAAYLAVLLGQLTSEYLDVPEGILSISWLIFIWIFLYSTQKPVKRFLKWDELTKESD